MTPGFFSIIIPVKAYNDYCRESLGACRQLYPDQELLFSPDEATSVPFEGVRVLPSGPGGPSMKRDLCATQAKGEVLAFLDDDAYPEAGWLEAAFELFKDPSIAAVGGPAVTPPHDSLRRWASGLVYASPMAGGNYAYRYLPRPARDVDDYPTCNLLVRRSVMQSIGGFGTEFWPGEDTVACLKIVHDLKQRIAYDPRVLVYHHRRELFQGHYRQVRAYAEHRGYFVKRFPKTSLRLSYFLPSLFVAGLALGWLPGLVFRPWLLLWASGLGLYALLALVQGLFSLGQAPRELRNLKLALLVSAGVAFTHVMYGLHFIKGLLAPSLSEERRGAK
jgi:hypothetical protein